MARDCFAILGLTPGIYKPDTVQRRFEKQRARLLAALHQPATHYESRRQLDELHIAYQTLVDPDAQRRYMDGQAGTRDALTRMRRLIAASLEDGLLRYSRRQEIIEQARRLGFSDFHAHLLIAQVQFGDTAIDLPPPSRRAPGATTEVLGRVLLISVLGVILFLLMRHWLGL